MAWEGLEAIRENLRGLEETLVAIMCHSEVIWWLTSKVLWDGKRWEGFVRMDRLDISREILGDLHERQIEIHENVERYGIMESVLF